MGDGIGQLNEAPLIEEKHESSMRLPSPPAASSASQVLLAARARIGRFPPWVRHSERRDDGRIAVRSSRLPHTRYCSLRASSCRSCSGCAACARSSLSAWCVRAVHACGPQCTASCTTHTL